MSQQIIDVGAAPNDGQGDPIRTAFVKCNNNFDQLFEGISSNSISNGNSNIHINTADGNIAMSVNAVSNVVVVTSQGLLVDGEISASGNVTGAFFVGNGSALTGVIAAGNVGVANLISNGTSSFNIPVADGNLVGNIGGNSLVYQFTGAGLDVNGYVTATGNIAGGNIVTGGAISATGNIRGASVYVAGEVSATANVTGQFISSAGGNIGVPAGVLTMRLGHETPTTIYLGSNASNIYIANANSVTAVAGNLTVGAAISSAGNITGNYILGNGSQLTGLPTQYSDSNVSSLLATFGSNTISTTGNVTSGNLFTAGLISTSGNVSAGNVATTGTISATGNVTTDGYFVGNFTGNISGNLVVPGSNTQVLYNNSGNAGASAGLTFEFASNTLTGSGNALFANVFSNGMVSATGNVTGGNIRTNGTISSTGNILTNANVSATTVVANSLLTSSGTIGVTANVLTMIIGNSTPTTIWLGGGASNVYIANANSVTTLAGNLSVGADISATGNITSGNIVTSGTVSATGNITGNYYSGNGRQLTGQGMSYRITAANSLSYLVNGGYANTTINLTRGQNYFFEITANSHPLWIKTDPVIGTGNAYSSGVTNNGSGFGTVGFQVPFDAPNTLYYQCQYHTGMYGILNITDGTAIQSGNSNVQVYANGDIALSANTTVAVSGGGTFRLPSLTAAEIANLTAANGDMIYNTTVNKIQGFENGSWGNLI